MPDRSIRGHRVRVTLLVLLCLLMASLFAVVARQSWTDTSADSRLATDEQRLAYPGPLAHLVGALTETQSAVVRGAPMDTNAVQSAVSAVGDVENRYLGNLSTGQLWDDLREKITRAITQLGTGQAGYQTFADILSLSLDLVQRVGDTSDLIRDSQLASVLTPQLTEELKASVES